jgi:hypothetical protein
LPLRRCTIRVRIGTKIQTVNIYADRPGEPHKSMGGGTGTYNCQATGSFSGHTFTGTWKTQKKSGQITKTETGSMTVTLGGPLKAFPPGAPKDRVVMLPTKVTSFSATLNKTSTNANGLSTITENLTLSGSGLDLHEPGSTMLRQLGFSLKSVFEYEQRQHQYGFTTLTYAAEGPDVSGTTTVAWNRRQINGPTTKQQTLIETKGNGSCTLAFQFH